MNTFKRVTVESIVTWRVAVPRMLNLRKPSELPKTRVPSQPVEGCLKARKPTPC